VSSKRGDTHITDFGIIMSFSLTTPFMMSLMVLGSDGADDLLYELDGTGLPVLSVMIFSISCTKPIT
jgi:hypothetical protein